MHIPIQTSVMASYPPSTIWTDDRIASGLATAKSGLWEFLIEACFAIICLTIPICIKLFTRRTWAQAQRDIFSPLVLMTPFTFIPVIWTLQHTGLLLHIPLLDFDVRIIDAILPKACDTSTELRKAGTDWPCALDRLQTYVGRLVASDGWEHIWDEGHMMAGYLCFVLLGWIVTLGLHVCCRKAFKNWYDAVDVSEEEGVLDGSFC